jgi:hypothetical protein
MSDIGVLVTLDEESAKTPIVLDYTSRDYTSIRAQLVGLASGILPEWNTLGDGVDFGTLILELFAYMGDTLNFYIDRTASEAFLTTAMRPQSVMYIADMLGYKPMGQHAASVTLYFSMATQAGDTQLPPVKLPKGTRIHNQSENSNTLVVFETQQEITVTPGDGEGTKDPIECFATEGITRRDVFLGVAAGAPNTNFTLPDSGVVYGTVEISTKEGFQVISWSSVTDLSLARPTQPVFTTYSDEKNLTHVVFGDNAVGRIPSVNSEVYANYRYGAGAAANLVQPEDLSVIIPPPNTDITDVSVRNDISPLGGSDPETVESMKYSIPRAGARIRNRAVTLADYGDLAVQVPGVSKSVAYGTVYTSVNVRIAPSTEKGDLDAGGMKALCAEVTQYMQDKMLIGSAVFVGPEDTDDLWTNIYIRVNVHVVETYNRSSVREQVDAVLHKYLSYDVVDFGTRISMGDIYRTVLTVQGVAWAELRWLSTGVPTIDYPGAVAGSATSGSITKVYLKSAWKFDNVTTMANPGNNHYRLNNATTPTIIALSTLDNVVVDRAATLALLQIGDHIVIQRSAADPLSYWDLVITATPVNNTTWYQMTVRSTASSVALPPADEEIVGVELISYSPSPEASGDISDIETNELKIPRIEPTEKVEDSEAKSEVQVITPSGTISGGSFTITLLAATTAALPHNSTAADIKAAINVALPDNKVSVSGGPAHTAAVTLTYAISYGNVAQATLGGSGVTGGGSLAVTTSTEGIAAPWIAAGYTEDERTHDGLWVTADGGLANS